MNGLFDADNAATPLTHDEMDGLIPTHVTLRSELNQLEQKGIVTAEQWAFGRQHRILEESFLKALHNRMFKDVWRWAGKYRKTEKNIGIDPRHIEAEMRKFLGDALYWIENNTYSPDEIAARFHHRIVLIHPFPNGNGRHGRLAADLLIVSLSGNRFEWGQKDLVPISETRQRYIAALKSADNHDIRPLLSFYPIMMITAARTCRPSSARERRSFPEHSTVIPGANVLRDKRKLRLPARHRSSPDRRQG